MTLFDIHVDMGKSTHIQSMKLYENNVLQALFQHHPPHLNNFVIRNV